MAAPDPHVAPVRHHSPAAARYVDRLIRETRPEVILVEGPSDATAMIPLLLDPDTVPPVALYAYRTGEPGRAIFYPMCRYSPEYVALRVGQEIGAELRFCDRPAALTLDEIVPAVEATPGAAATSYPAFAAALSHAAGFDTFDQLWEAVFEQEAERRGGEGFLEVMTAFGAKVRSLEQVTSDQGDLAREQHMADVAAEVIAGGVLPERVLLVCGAAHATVVAELLRRPPRPSPERIKAGRQAEIALAPFSFRRLSEQSGYGAGNRAPWYYQQVWELGGDYPAATRRSLVVLARRLREQGRAGSLAQAVDAWNLAVALAALRGKLAPGVDETLDAALACFGQDHPGPVGAAVWQVLVGDAIGVLSRRVGRTPLQTEFYAQTHELRLPVIDEERQVLLHMATPREAEASVFLHRLRVAEVPYGRELESGLGGGGRPAAASALQQLGRVREKWALQWTPATDAQLIERSVWGSTLAEVCGRRLAERLAAAPRIDVGASVLLELTLCNLPDHLPATLERCESLAADSTSFAPLARATYTLDGLLGYGSARQLPVAQLTALGARLFTRAALHLPASAICGDDGEVEVREALIPLYELARRGTAMADPEQFWRSVVTISEMEESHPGLRGLALALLELDGRLASDLLTARLRYWLSVAADAADNARLLAGLFALHRATLVRNRALIGAVSDFLLDLEIEQLIPLLPVLRRSLGTLSAAERRYLAETLAALLGLTGAEVRWALTLAPDEVARVREVDARVTATLDQWSERYGIGNRLERVGNEG